MPSARPNCSCASGRCLSVVFDAKGVLRSATSLVASSADRSAPRPVAATAIGDQTFGYPVESTVECSEIALDRGREVDHSVVRHENVPRNDRVARGSAQAEGVPVVLDLEFGPRDGRRAGSARPAMAVHPIQSATLHPLANGVAPLTRKPPSVATAVIGLLKVSPRDRDRARREDLLDELGTEPCGSRTNRPRSPCMSQAAAVSARATSSAART